MNMIFIFLSFFDQFWDMLVRLEGCYFHPPTFLFFGAKWFVSYRLVNPPSFLGFFISHPLEGAGP